MTTTPIDTSGISVPTSKPTKPFAVPYERPERASATGIVVPAFTPAPIVPKAVLVNAVTCSGVWPASPETLAAIKADVASLGTDAKKDRKAYIFIAACILRGIDVGECIEALASTAGLWWKHIRTLLHVPNAPWQKGPDGRYRLI